GFSLLFIQDGSINPAGTVINWPVFADTLNSDYRLIPGSPAIDVGDSSFFDSGENPDLSAISTDLRGADRIMGSNIDLGAYEFCHLTTTPTVSISSSPSTTVPANTTVLFTATISNGGTNPKIEWWKNSHQIPGANMLTYSAIAGSDFMDGD